MNGWKQGNCHITDCKGFKDFKIMLPPDGYSNNLTYGTQYWGVEKNVPNLHIAFTPLRQNIVLLMACLNNEL